MHIQLYKKTPNFVSVTISKTMATSHEQCWHWWMVLEIAHQACSESIVAYQILGRKMVTHVLSVIGDKNNVHCVYGPG